ncbi:hypothetical protein [Streptomyces sp. NPDC051014]|uniref:double-stranded RNA binding motif domain-containing protein n=1 Tax=Streptomyces sp. NPDC051014 TaxID=3155751 RepID=UPI0033E22261
MLTTARHGWPTNERTDPTGTSVEAVPPSTLSTLDANAWTEHLKTACVHGQLSRTVRAEVLRHTAAGQMSLRDMRIVLLVADGDQVWAPAREAVMAAAATDAATVRNLLILHVQLEMWPPLAVLDTPDGAQARIGQPGHEVTGPVRRGPNRQHAREAAQISLLAHLAGATDPFGAGGLPAPCRELTGRGGLGMDAFEALLDEDITLPVPRPLLLKDLLGRAERGQFQHRHMYELLFTASGPGWHRARTAMLDVVAQRSGYAAALLAMRSKAFQGPLFAYDESRDDGAEHPHVITAWIETGGGVVRGNQCRARGRRAGRHRAAVSLLSELTGLAEPEVRLPDELEKDKPATTQNGRPATSGGDDRKRTNALMDLNQLKMDEEITKPEWAYESVGTVQKPRFSCTGSCEVRGWAVRADGRGRNKSDARMAAAEALLDHVRQSRTEAGGPLTEPPAAAGTSNATAPQSVKEAELEAAPADAHTVPVQRAAPTAHLSAASAVGEAVASGCALTLIGPAPGRAACLLLYRDDGAAMPPAALPVPLAEAVHELALARGSEARRAQVAGWALPVPFAVGTLIATDESAAGMHPSAAAWARVLRFGLELVADGLVHPAVGDDGTGVWRPGPLAGAHRTMLDGLVEHLPPHAHCELLPANDPTALRITSPDEAVDTVLTTLADTLVATPGVPALFGTHPFTTPAQHLPPAAAAVGGRP